MLCAQVGGAVLQKGKFTWITEAGRQERWIVASCGAYTVLWNFRCVHQSSKVLVVLKSRVRLGSSAILHDSAVCC